ncbi:MAG: hypothetical protein GEU99_11480 [Luteitalea sp.]|nr:hypothetical protein [Luteitalea sp.]
MTLQHARAVAGRLWWSGLWRLRRDSRHTFVPRVAVTIHLVFAMVAAASPQDPPGEIDAQALTVDERATLTASNGQAEDRFGWSAAVDGATIVVGAPYATIGENEAQGVAYVFVRSRNGWSDAVETATLTASDGAALDSFGSTVAVYRDTIVVGAPLADVGENADQGVVYVFTRPAGGWTDMVETATLRASDGAALDSFGSAVAIARSTLAVGAPFAAPDGNAYQGAAYVFARPEDGWADAFESGKLTASDGAAGDRLGWSVATNGDEIVAGAPLVTIGENLQQGAAYVFKCPPGGWTSVIEAAKLTPSRGAPSDWFGHSVAMSGGTVAVAAPFSDVDGNDDQGAVYVFVKPEGRWIDATETATLTAPDGAAADLFGWSVAMSVDTLVVGAPATAAAGNVHQGAAHIFTQPPAGWTSDAEVVKLTSANGAAEDVLGAAVAVTVDAVVVGASSADTENSDQGSAHVFSFSKADVDAPTTTITLTPAAPDGANDWFVTSPTVIVSASDQPTGSGVTEVRCVLDPASTPASVADLPPECIFTGGGAELIADGNHTLYAAAVDAAGNASVVESASVSIDRTPPSVTCDAPAPLFVINQDEAEVWATVEDATCGPAASRVAASANTTSGGNQSTTLRGTDLAGHTTKVACPYTVAVPRTLTFFLHGRDIEETGLGFTMDESPPPPQPLIVNLLGTPSWLTEPTLTGTFLEDATFEFTIPCALALTLTKTVRLAATNAEGGDEQVLGETTRPARLCVEQETLTIPVTAPVELTNQRLKLTISSLSVGVNLNTGHHAVVRATSFVGEP